MNIWTLAIATDGVGKDSKLVGITYHKVTGIPVHNTILVDTGALPEKTIDFHGVTNSVYHNEQVSVFEAQAMMSLEIPEAQDTFVFVNNKGFVQKYLTDWPVMNYIVDITKLGTVFLKTVEHAKEYQMAKGLWVDGEYRRIRDILEAACDHTSYKKWLQKYDIQGSGPYPSAQVLAIETLFRSIWSEVSAEEPALSISDMDSI